jgi:hypothetical protein
VGIIGLNECGSIVTTSLRLRQKWTSFNCCLVTRGVNGHYFCGNYKNFSGVSTSAYLVNSVCGM